MITVVVVNITLIDAQMNITGVVAAMPIIARGTRITSMAKTSNQRVSEGAQLVGQAGIVPMSSSIKGRRGVGFPITLLVTRIIAAPAALTYA